MKITSRLGADLQVRDNVVLFDGPFGTATVRKVDREKREIIFFRPYVQTSDFEYTGGVIPYIGIEEFSVCLDDSRPFKVWEKNA